MIYGLAALAARVNHSERREYWLTLMFWPPVLIGLASPIATRSLYGLILVGASMIALIGRCVCRARGGQAEVNWVVAVSFVYWSVLIGVIIGLLRR